MSKVVAVLDDDLTLMSYVENVIEAKLPDYEVHKIRVLNAPPSNLPARVDVFFVDYRMGELRGPDLVRELKEKYPRSYVIGWSTDSSVAGAFRQAGADIFIVKGTSMQKIVELVKHG